MILVTGATGLVGAHTLYRLLQDHDRVVALKRKTSSLDNLREIFGYYTREVDALMDRIDWREGDLLDKESLPVALEGISVVVNCAAIVSFDPRDRKRMIKNNVEGVGNLVEAIKMTDDEGRMTKEKIKPLLIHISSTSALGDSPGKDPHFFVDEETPRDPKRKHSGYSESKHLSEKVIQESFINLSQSPIPPIPNPQSPVPNPLNILFLNPGIVLGPGQWGKGSSQLFVKAWEGLNVYPFGGTGYVDVRDVAEIVGLMMENKGQRPKAKGQSKLKVEKSIAPSPVSLRTRERGLGVRWMHGERYCLVGANLRYKEFFDMVTDAYGKRNPQMYAGSFLSGLAWRLDTLRARLTGKFPLITRETAEAAQRISYYSSGKVKEALDFEFRPIDETVRWVCDCFTRTLREK